MSDNTQPTVSLSADAAAAAVAPSADALAARADLARLKSDPAFIKAWSSGDAESRLTMDRLHKAGWPDAQPADNPAAAAAAPASAAAPAPSDAAVADARAKLAALKSDPAWVQKYLAGDAATRKEANQLFEAGHPGASDGKVAKPIDAPAGEQADLVDAPPETISGYKFAYKPGVEIDSAFDREARGLMLDMGLPQGVASLVFNRWEDSMAQARKAGRLPNDTEIELGRRSAEATLRERFGSAFDSKIAAARSVIDSLGPEKSARVRALLDRAGLANDAQLVVSLAAIGERRAAKAKAK